MSFTSRSTLTALLALVCGIGLLTVRPAHAAAIIWDTWTKATSGESSGYASASIASSPTPVTISYAGEVESLELSYPSWDPSSSYIGGTVSNGPPQSGNSIQLFGGNSNVDTLTFSTPITNPVMAIWSLGSSIKTAQFDFTSTEPFTIEAGGPNREYGGSSIYTSSSTPSVVYGTEGNGVIQFNGTYSSITWTNPIFENWYGFTVGIAAVVPEPASLSIVAGIGLLAMRRPRSLIGIR
jgi:hypothetical protein